MLNYNKNGITLVALIATIMITIIFATTVIVSYSSFSVSAKKKAFANEIYTLQKQVEDYYFRNNKYPTVNERKISTSELDEKLLDIFSNNSEEIAENKITLYEIDYKKLDLDSLSRGVDITENSKDIYLFSKTTKKVYYIQGEKIGDEAYYYLDNDLYSSLKMK